MKILQLLTISFLLQWAPNNTWAKFSAPPKGVSTHTLDNGINVIFIRNTALPMVGINTVVKVGSAYETYSSSGMSHMLEHLLFNGTSQWSQKQLYDMTDKIGGYNNANTSEYYTNYMMVTPTDKIKKGMEIQAGMLFDSIIPEAKFDKEKGIVLEEIAKSLANPREKISRSVRKKLYAGHGLSLPTLGTYETIKNMEREDVVQFYRNNYVPNNMEISVIGDFNSTEMLKLINEVYGHASPDNVSHPISKQWSTGFEQPNPIINQQNVDFLFHSGEDTIIQSFYTLDNYSSDFYSLLMDALAKNIEKTKAKLEKLFPDQIKAITLNVHNQPIGNYLQADIRLSDNNNMSAIVEKFDLLLKQQEIKLSPEYINSQAIKSQTAFLKQIEKPHMFGIYNADLIAKQGVAAIINEFSGNGIIQAGEKVNHFVIKGAPYLLIQYPEAYQKNNLIEKANTKLFENNENNATVIVKQNINSELLAIHYMIKYKQGFENNHGKGFAKIWHDIFGKRMKSENIQSLTAQYGLSFTVNDIPFLPMDDIYLSPTFGYIRVEGLATNIKGVIDFLNNQMLNFKPRKDEFEKALKKYSSKGMMHQSKNPSKELMNKHYEALLYKPDTDQVSALKDPQYSSFLTFGENYFTPSNMIISVVSKENVETINQYFAPFSRKSLMPFSGLAKQKTFKSNIKATTIKESLGGEQAHLFYGFIKDIDLQDKVALKVLSLMLRDEIVFNIREKQGLAYRMSAGIKINDDKALFYIKLPSQPSNVSQLENQFDKLISPKFAEKITQDNLDKTINKYLGKMMFRRLSSINQAYYLAHSYYFDGDISTDKADLQAFKSVVLTDVKRVAKKYLKNKNAVRITIN